MGVPVLKKSVYQISPVSLAQEAFARPSDQVDRLAFLSTAPSTHR
jgi:hypothetical protein